VLAAGPGVLASHRSAAYLHGVPRPDDDPVDLILVRRSREVQLDGVVAHRPRDRRDLEPIRRVNIPTTKLLRWAVDLGAVDPAGRDAAIGHVLHSGFAKPGALALAVRTHSRQGRPGVRNLREVLDGWLLDGKLLDSELERLMRRLVKKHRLPRMRFHAVIAGFEVDFLVEDAPVVLECDGFAVHGRRRGFEEDRRRDAELAALGNVVVRFTYMMLTRQPRWVATKVEQAVRQFRSGRLLSHG
jgi:very-short-patch-repair endonuclease